MARRGRRARWRPVVAGAVTALLAGAAGWLLFNTNAAEAGSISGPLFRDPDTTAARWVAEHPADSRTRMIRDRIADRPQARWFADYHPETVQAAVAGYVTAANAADQIPQLVFHALPNRDCAGQASGGAPDLAAYQSWIATAAKGLGDRLAIVLLEPGSLTLQSCLTAAEATARDAALAHAVESIKLANHRAKVYLDAGHSGALPVAEIAGRLVSAGVTDLADGFFSNVANYRTTASEVRFGRSLLNRLGAPRLHQIIDVGRNGRGPLGSEWCDPAGRRVGADPTTETGEATVDALLWVKPPGEADGCRGSAGAFVADLAYELAAGGERGVSTVAAVPPADLGDADTPAAPESSPPATPEPEPTTPASSATGTPSSPPASPSAVPWCAVRYRVDREWTGGFAATVIITNPGPRMIFGWTLAFSLPGDQIIVNMWNATRVQYGRQVTVYSAPYGATIPGNGGQFSFGFQAMFTVANPSPAGFALNGVPCAAG